MATAGTLAAGAAAATSCDGLLLPAREVRGQKVGPASCLMQEADITANGRGYKRIDIGLDGTVDGFAAKVGDYKDYFTNGPDLVFRRRGARARSSSASRSTSAPRGRG